MESRIYAALFSDRLKAVLQPKNQMRCPFQNRSPWGSSSVLLFFRFGLEVGQYILKFLQVALIRLHQIFVRP